MNTFDTNFEKQKIAIEYTIRGLSSIDKRYAKVLRAFEIAKTYHTGIRKDGKTPEFKHQLNIVGSILNYREMLIDPVGTLIAALMHDVIEDYSKGSKVWDKEEERSRLSGLPFYNTEDLRREFGDEAVAANNCLSKVINGYKKGYEQYFSEMSSNVAALIAKSEDRDDNLNSMYYVFTVGKQESYAKEVFDYFIPALKEGEKNHPEQAQVYQMLKIRLKRKAQSVLDSIKTFKDLGFDFNLTINENISKMNKQW